jgi:hypothetical protein
VTPRSALAVLAALVTGACSASGGPGDPPIDGPPRDAPPPCGAQTLELGRCVLESGAPCTGALGEVRRFDPLPDGGEVAIVSGPQGSAMLVFSARTTDIVPGDPADPVAPSNPLIEIVVARDGHELAVYRGKVGFADDGAARLVAVGLFVITDGFDLAGAALVAHGRLTDAAGAGRCGEVAFVAAAP